MTFLPCNLPSTDLHPEVVDQELFNEVAASHMSVPFILNDATTIFGGFFQCFPVGLMEKVPSDGNWRMIRNLSKQDSYANSLVRLR